MEVIVTTHRSYSPKYLVIAAYNLAVRNRMMIYGESNFESLAWVEIRIEIIQTFKF